MATRLKAANGRLRSVWLDVAGLALVAAALRLPGLFTDFWLDEIWSYDLARRARSVLDVFFARDLKHDNNHHLNTLVLYLLRDHPGWVVYRLPAIAAGVLTVVAVVVIGRRRSRADGLITGLLVAVSFMMIVYSTEARGYALMLLFATLAFLALRRYLDSPGWSAAAGFWVSIALGLAAQSAISHFYLGALAWSVWRLRRKPRDLVRLHAVSIVYGLAWAAGVLWGAVIGGGPSWTWRQVADQSLAWTLGYPLSTVPVAIGVALTAAVVLWDARRLWIEGSDEGLFYVAVIFGPAVLVAALNPPWLFPRYFLISLLFLLVVIGRTLGRLWSGSREGKLLAAAALGILAIGNVRHAVLFSRDGRGGASQAVPYMVTHTPTREILVTSLSIDLWSSLPIPFYEEKLGLGAPIRYVSRRDLASGTSDAGIDWVIVQSQGEPTVPSEQVVLPSGAVFTLAQRYPAYGPSGMYWYLYGRKGTVTTDPRRAPSREP